ncbi:MAG: RagB/SusD family nutrient uptake outer membrane protein [Bacteroidia bacterium]
MQSTIFIMNRIISLYLFGLLIFVVQGCSSDFLDTKNTNAIDSTTFYSNEKEAVQAVNSVYAALQRLGLYHRSIFFMLDFSSDEIAPTPNTQTPPTQLLNYTFDATNEHIVGFWNDNYVAILRANTVLEQLPNVPDLSASMKNRLEGEARFIRALCYLNLVSNFGGVPLRKDTETQIARDLAKATSAEVYAQIEEDLKFAEANLPRRSQYAADDLGRATSGAATGLLGKAYVYQQKWADAEAALQRVVSSNEYALVSADRLQNSFNQLDENNEESLFEVQFTSNLNGGGGAWAVDENTGWGGNGEGNFRPKEYGVNGFAFYNAKPSDAIADAFEPGDPRKQAFMFGPGSTFNGAPYDTIFATSGYAIAKYTDPAPGAGGAPDDSGINIRVLRYADVLLLLAEAKLRQNKNGEALALINQVRRRADPSGSILPDRTDESRTEEYLIHERRVELCFECQRRVDVARWGLGTTIFGSKFINNKHEVFPIPQNEIDLNGAVTQNAGY